MRQGSGALGLRPARWRCLAIQARRDLAIARTLEEAVGSCISRQDLGVEGDLFDEKSRRIQRRCSNALSMALRFEVDADLERAGLDVVAMPTGSEMVEAKDADVLLSLFDDRERPGRSVV